MKKLYLITGLLMLSCMFVLASYGREAGRRVFDGRVIHVNVVDSTMTARIGSTTVTFDTTHPTLSGYRSLADIRRGDRVGVSYTHDGIMIKRLTGKPERDEPPTRQGTPERVIRQETPAKKHTKATNGLQRQQRRNSNGSFEDVDVNKDGRITPVELSTLITDITMEKFREYDRNADGGLDRVEFTEIFSVKRPPRVR